MLKTRILTAAILIPSFLAALFLLPALYWSFLMLFICAIGLSEWADMAKLSMRLKVCYVVTPVVTCAFLILAKEGMLAQQWLSDLYHPLMFWSILVATIFWVLVAPVWLGTRYQIKSKLLMLIIGLTLLAPTWFAMVSLRNMSYWFLLSVMLVVWIADSAAYFAGKRFGKHKLAPLISPGKTWEGVVGAIFAITLYGLILCQVFDESYWLVVGLWTLVVLSIMGDLLESLIKRQAGVKDSGKLLPGHGGILDRIDGLIPTLPLTVFYVYFPLYSVWLTHG
jgi:phosphatidate cytidylyltransferase